MKRKKVLFFIIIICICTWVFLHFENNFITITKITVKSPKLPDAFDGCKIVHLSDLHSKEFGKGQKNIVKKIEDAQPDLIVFTGDLIDSRHFDAEVSLELIRQIVKIAPTYFVTGNHERWSGNFDALEKVLKENGIHVLRNTCDRIGKDKDGIYITGIDDPVSTQAIYEETKVVENEIKQALKEIKENDVFKILLAHRPDASII
mgnify:FL=1